MVGKAKLTPVRPIVGVGSMADQVRAAMGLGENIAGTTVVCLLRAGRQLMVQRGRASSCSGDIEHEQRLAGHYRFGEGAGKGASQHCGRWWQGQGLLVVWSAVCKWKLVECPIGTGADEARQIVLSTTS